MTLLFEDLAKIDEIKSDSFSNFFNQARQGYKPLVLKQGVAHWPVVQAANESESGAYTYLKNKAGKHPVDLFSLDKSNVGKMSYREGLEGLTYQTSKQHFSDALKQIFDASLNQDIDLYCGSVDAQAALSDFSSDNSLDGLDPRIKPRIWLGTDVQVAAHYDTSDNLACVVAGKRRFILFPPDQISNLYIGPIDFTLAGRPASLVDFDAVDYEKFPRFREALKHAVVAELNPGDVLYIPNLWWHQVASLGGFNGLVNYWWADPLHGGGSAYNALIHGLMSVSALPPEQRQAWRAFYDHYIFKVNGDPAAHIPVERRGVLGRMTPDLYAKIRQFLQKSMGLK